MKDNQYKGTTTGSTERTDKSKLQQQQQQKRPLDQGATHKPITGGDKSGGFGGKK